MIQNHKFHNTFVTMYHILKDNANTDIFYGLADSRD